MPCCGGGSNGPCACRSGTRDVEGDSAVGLRMSGPNDPTPEQISLKGECAPEKCSGCPARGACSSRGADNSTSVAISERIQHVGRILLVLSGKGGVGKSTLATQLAFFLADIMGKYVGLLDLDICGPSIPTMTFTKTEQVQNLPTGWEPVSVSHTLQALSVGHLVTQEDAPVILRGPKKHGMVKQMLTETNWEFDPRFPKSNIIIVDTPPGTSDEHLSIIDMYQSTIRYMQSNGFPNVPVLEAVVISTPQEVALADVRKEINFCKQLNLRIRGVIENMSGFVCPFCEAETPVIEATTGGVKKMCEDMNVPYIGSMPLDPQLMKAGEDGVAWSTICDIETSPGYDAFANICGKIIE
ncbi:Nucleotide-binding protein 35 [Giardia duodenalis]|uniref:Nucleotide-binding protein 35 n=1 Tax=Giardia intestinalis (strain ATCC 50803 / WB clone C6) TaxID=184922 RepID=A0A644F0Z2_GIAIC|nr:Nucleotide-binding protein 35 [Giardia intestinalis]KAE8302030.1 Nucleotide-binding protein 35 [Giardia intestinalis]